MVAPEYILGKAIGDFVFAWRMRKKMKNFAAEDKVEWDLAHCYYANMGGFVAIEECSPTTGSNTEPEQHELKDKDAPRPDAHPKVENSEAAAQNEKVPITLTAHNFYWLWENEHIVGGKLPDITAAEIHDKSKGNIFVKAIAVVKVFSVSV